MRVELLNIPFAYLNESLRGYLIRLAEDNCLDRANWVLDVKSEIARLKGLYGPVLNGRVPPWLEAAWSPAPDGIKRFKTARFGGSARYCVLCLRDAPYWRVEWEHVYYMICHRHGVRMIDSCQGCGCLLSISRQSLLRCSCGMNILDTNNVRSATKDEVELCSVLASYLTNDVAALESVCDQNLLSISRSATLEELETLISFLGGWIVRDGINTRVGPPKFSDVEHTYRQLSSTAHLLSNWPHNFMRMIEELSDHPSPVVMEREISNSYRPFMASIQRRLRSKSLSFVIKAYQDFLVEHWEGTLSRRQRWVTDEVIKSHRYISGKAACKALVTTRSHVKRLILDRVLSGHITRAGGHYDLVVVDSDSIAQAKLQMEDLVSTVFAARMLNLPKGRVRELGISGLLSVRMGTRGNRHVWMFSRKEIAAFIKRLSSSARSAASDEDLISCHVLLKCHIAPGDEFSRFVLAVLDGSISVRVDGGAALDFASIQFSKRDLAQWRAAQASNGGRKLKIVEVAAELGIKQEVAYHLVRAAIIPSTTETLGRRKCRFVFYSDIDVFKQTYVTTSALVSSWGTSEKKLVQLLADEGVRPIAGPSIDGCRQYFFRRSDVMNGAHIA